ncbi:MAG: hypothetical protein AABX34_02640 [Nanoarchaeota archaeon]
MDDTMQLGGNIELSGFSGIDGASMIVLKKIIGNYGKHLSEISGNFEKLSLAMKPVHEPGENKKFEVHGKLVNSGKPLASEVTERNLFVAVDNALKKIVSQIS